MSSPSESDSDDEDDDWSDYVDKEGDVDKEEEETSLVTNFAPPLVKIFTS